MRRIYRQGLDGRAAFRRRAALTPPTALSAGSHSEGASAAPDPIRRGRVVSFAIRVARAFLRRVRPFIRPLAFRVRRYLSAEHAAQLEAVRQSLHEGSLLTATWSVDEQTKLAARVLSEVQASRRMVLDRAAAADAKRAISLERIAEEISSIRRTLAADAGGRLAALLDPALIPGATVVCIGAVSGELLEYCARKVGATGRVTVLGESVAPDTAFAEAAVDILRIDAAGVAPAIFQGARRALARHPRMVVSVRFDRAALEHAGVSTRAWLATFADAGLSGRLTGTSLHPAQPVTAASLEQVEFAELVFSPVSGREG